jgi:hypothetical protein
LCPNGLKVVVFTNVTTADPEDIALENRAYALLDFEASFFTKVLRSGPSFAALVRLRSLCPTLRGITSREEQRKKHVVTGF